MTICLGFVHHLKTIHSTGTVKSAVKTSTAAPTPEPTAYSGLEVDLRGSDGIAV